MVMINRHPHKIKPILGNAYRLTDEQRFSNLVNELFSFIYRSYIVLLTVHMILSPKIYQPSEAKDQVEFSIREDERQGRWTELFENRNPVAIEIGCGKGRFIINSAMAYPGSPLYLEARKKNWKLPDRYAGYSQHSYYTQNLRNENLSAVEILNFRDDAWLKFHTNQNYLNLLESKFGAEAKSNVEDASKIQLKRKLLGD